eukprot:TRINITY_DN1870_c0_g3_i2.p1 TRINITY_DN1870_c0_g3~~TRINITY_DN1870_c0_g3_i2.p1  ORF type:complete len:618 (-),score=184.58 TRINITY_DN1870_c0_g3_i2:208-1884(-)
MGSIARKNNLGKNLMRMSRLFPKEYSFFPPTWLLPFEWTEFRNQFNSKKCKTFIVKPEALSQGKGIFLTRTWKDLDPEEHYVVQRYIHKPYLIDGLKFDLRIYVLVYGCDPLRIFIFREGLARLATDPYVPPNNSNLADFFMHLTNYAINKNNDEFIFNNDPDKADVGHKRSLEFVWRHIDENGGSSEEIRGRIKEIIVKTLCSVQPELANSYRSCQPSDDKNDKCFEILGFDILIDSKFKPWLLEVNHSPSFSTDTPFDMKIKLKLITDTVKILHILPKKRLKYYKEKEVAMQNSKFSKHRVRSLNKLSKEERAEHKRRHMEKRDKYELENCGDFERIYPDPYDPNKYSRFIEAANKMWEEFFGLKKNAKKAQPEATTKNTTKAPAVKKHPTEPLEKNQKLYQMETSRSLKEDTASTEGNTSRKEAKPYTNSNEVLARIYKSKSARDHLPLITKPSTKGSSQIYILDSLDKVGVNTASKLSGVKEGGKVTVRLIKDVIKTSGRQTVAAKLAESGKCEKTESGGKLLKSEENLNGAPIPTRELYQKHARKQPLFVSGR